MQRKSKCLAAGCVLLLFMGDIAAQQTVYKWIDRDGVVHFSDARPDPDSGFEIETITTAAPLPGRATVEIPTDDAPASAPTAPVPIEPAAEPPVDKDPSQMNLAELDKRCEAARKEKISPLREAEIAKCQADRRNDPAWCERFNATFGEGGWTVNGTIRPRMFDDLPECVTALNERNRRGR